MSHTVIPQIGFFFSPSVGVPPTDPAPERRGLKAAVKSKIEYIDPDQKKRGDWASLPPVTFDHIDGHISEGVVKYALGEEIKKLVDNAGNGTYTIGAQVEWCYAVRDQTIICYHCYELHHNNEAVMVTAGEHSVSLTVYYSWELSFDMGH